MDVNFKGPARTYPYVSALTLLMPDPENSPNRRLASTDSPLKDAYVLVGPSALGIFDMRAFPFDTNVPGVEGHATILDNIISNDWMRSGTNGHLGIIVLLLMIFGAMVFAYFTEKLESVPALDFVRIVGIGAGTDRRQTPI